MTKADLNNSEPALWLFLAVAAFFLGTDSLADLAITTYPHRWGAPEWRFGAVGLFGGRIDLLIVAELLLFAALVRRQSRVALRFWAVVAMLAAVTVPVVLGLFMLDALVVRSGLSPEAGTPFLVASLRVAVLLAGFSALNLWLAVLVLRLTKQDQSDEVGILVPTTQGAGKPG